MTIDINWDKPIRMKDGRPVRHICGDRRFAYDPRFKHVILIDDPVHGELLATVMDDGRLFDGPDDSPNAHLCVENWEGLQ